MVGTLTMWDRRRKHDLRTGPSSLKCLFSDSLIQSGIFLCYLNYLPIHYGVTSLTFHSSFYFLI